MECPWTCTTHWAVKSVSRSAEGKKKWETGHQADKTEGGGGGGRDQGDGGEGEEELWLSHWLFKAVLCVWVLLCIWFCEDWFNSLIPGEVIRRPKLRLSGSSSIWTFHEFLIWKHQPAAPQSHQGGGSFQVTWGERLGARHGADTDGHAHIHTTGQFRVVSSPTLQSPHWLHLSRSSLSDPLFP